MAGTVTISVYDWDTQENGPGAQNVAWIDLSGATEGRIGAVRMTGNYGNVDPELGGPIHASHAACLEIGGDVVNEISLDLYGSGYVDGDVQIDGDVLAPVLSGAIISGSLTINGNVLSPVTPVGAHGTITVAGLVAAPFVCGFNSDDVRFTATGTHTADIELGFIWPEHTLEIAGSSAASVELPELEGSISCAGSLAALTVNGLLTPDSTITIGQNAGTITLGQGYHWFCGTLSVAGDVSHIGIASAMSSDAEINVTGSVGTCLLGGFMVGPCPGTITIGSVDTLVSSLYGLSGSLSITTLENSASIEFLQNTTGTINIGTAAGRIAMADTVTAAITIGTFTGAISIGNGSVQPPFAGSLNIGTMNGNVFLWNGFAHNQALDPDVAEVQIGTKAADALFVVNDDGRNRGDEYWQSGAAVQIGTEPPYAVYWGPNEGQGLWEATCCKGDCDNSGGELNSFDIDPFVLLLTDPAAYCATYPGLCGSGYDPEEGAGGSAIYRGDLNCDGDINSFDIDPFVLKLTDPNAWYALHPKRCASPVRECCPSCGENDLFADTSEMAEAEDDSLLADTGEADADALVSGTTPSAVAAFLGASVAPEHFANLLSLVQDAAAESADTPRGAFWTAVAEQLSGE